MSTFSLGNKLDTLSRSLEDSYFAYKRIHHIASKFLPNQDEIYLLCDKLFELVYPGFFGRQDLSLDNINDHIRNELEDISSLLYRQVFQGLSCRSSQSTEVMANNARHITENFITVLPRVRELLASDILAVYKGDPAAQDTDEAVFSYPATVAIGTYRLAHELWELKVPYMPRIMTEHAHSHTGIDIHPGAKIGRSFFIDHGTGVVIGETTIIGENCKLYQGVTLGAPSFPHDEHGQIVRDYKRHPTLEDDVIVYSNASILGNVTVGKGATVGGSVFLTRSVPPGCTVSVKPAELKYRNRPTMMDRGNVVDFQI